MAKKQNNLEWEITKGLYENKGQYTEEIYLATFELCKDDDKADEKVKKLLETRVLEQIRMIYGRQSAEGNLGADDFISWIKYIYFNEM